MFPERLQDRLVPPVQSDHHRLPFEKVTVQIPADHVLTARLEEVYNFGKVFGCCIFTCYTCHRNHTSEKIHNFELTSHLHSPRTMSKEPLPCERGRLSYVIVLFGLTHRALRKEKILDEGTKLFDAPLFMRNNRSQCGANMTNINMEQAPVGTMGTLLLQPGHLGN